MAMTIEQKAAAKLRELSLDPDLGNFVDVNHPIPKVHRGRGKIKLIVLGQDPTIRDADNRDTVTTVLKLDRPGNLKQYLSKGCDELGLDLDANIYATNYIKGFCTRPAADLVKSGVFKKLAAQWLPLLKEELSEFENVPVIALGQPILSVLVSQGVPQLVRYYWGYQPDWSPGQQLTFRYIKPSDNCLSKVIFPFPHLNSKNKVFYSTFMSRYIAFVKREINK